MMKIGFIKDNKSYIVINIVKILNNIYQLHEANCKFVYLNDKLFKNNNDRIILGKTYENINN